MWKYSNWNKYLKWGVTILFLILIISSLASSGSNSPSNQQTNSGNLAKVTATPTPQPTQTPTIAPTNKIKATPTNASSPTPVPTLGVSYDDMMVGLSDSFTMKQGVDVKGQPNYVGTDYTANTNLQLIGNKTNLSDVELMFIASQHNSENQSALVLAHQFIQNAAPDWSDGTTWVDETIVLFSNGTETKDSQITGNKEVKMNYYKDLGSVVIDVSPYSGM